jgi:hypothetical protein
MEQPVSDLAGRCTPLHTAAHRCTPLHTAAHRCTPLHTAALDFVALASSDFEPALSPRQVFIFD